MVTREAQGTVYTHAGPEIGVASTKAFTAQLTALYLLALYLGQVRGTITPEQAKNEERKAASLCGYVQPYISSVRPALSVVLCYRSLSGTCL